MVSTNYSSSGSFLVKSYDEMNHNLQLLPIEITNYIFTFCDYESLRNIAEAYPEYYDHIYGKALCLQPDSNLTRCRKLAEELAKILKYLLAPPKPDEPSSSNDGTTVNKNERCQLKFLFETLKLLMVTTEPILNYVKQNQVVVNSKNVELNWKMLGKHFRGIALLSDSLLGVMNELSDFFKNHFSHVQSCVLSDNFGIFDLCIRQKLYELKAFFPTTKLSSSSPQITGPLDSPLAVIACPKGREMWEETFGKRYSVEFDAFVEKLITKIFPHETKEQDFLNTLSYFINFPKNKYITPYKWDLFIKLFGPLPLLAYNFKESVFEKGFLGHINRVNAIRILKEQYNLRKKSLYILRFSRTVPDSLAISFIEKVNGNLRISNKLTKMLEYSEKGVVASILTWRYYADSDPVPYRTVGDRIVVERSSFARLSYSKQDFYDIITED